MTVERETLAFPDNWTYLRAELAWLDRVLMRAVARHRETEKEIAKQAKHQSDRATSHWWRGFILIDPSQGGSQLRPEPAELNHPLGRWGERLQHSQQKGIFLAIPQLCQHLNLSKFERDVLILCLAPEISRRYEKIYALLNQDDSQTRQPTIDLCLRLFCKSDQEWRIARTSFHSTAPLIKHKFLQLHPSPCAIRTLLAQSLTLPEKVVTYTLSDRIPLTSLFPRRRGKAKLDTPE